MCKQHLKQLDVYAFSELVDVIHVVSLIFIVQDIFIYFGEHRPCLLSLACNGNYLKD